MSTQKNIKTGHTYDQYRKKYGKKFDEKKLEFISFENKDKLNNKKKYWEIKDGKKPGFYEVSKKKFLIPLFCVLGAGAIATAIAVPLTVLGNKDNGYKAAIDIEGEGCSYEIEGGESLTRHKAGDVIAIDFSIEWGNDFSVEVEGAESYTYDDTTGKLTIVFGEKDVQITAQTTVAETATDQDEDDVIEVTYADRTTNLLSINEFRQDIISKSSSGISYTGCTAKLLKNVELDNNDNFQSLANVNESIWFNGNFNGNQKIVQITQNTTGLTGYDAGFFGNVYGETGNAITFSNLKLNLDISSGSNGQFVGGLMGYAIGSININNIEVDGIVRGSRIVGGLIGNAQRDRDSADQPLPDVMTINDCVVNAEVNGYARRTTDDYTKVGGFVGQTLYGDLGGAYAETARLELNDCSFNGSLTDDFTACTKTHYSLMGYVTSSSGAEGQNDKTVINNFTVSSESTIQSDTNKDEHNYPFEGLNLATDEPSYVGTPNYYKELIGGYFNTAIIDGEVNPTKVGDKFPHGGSY